MRPQSDFGRSDWATAVLTEYEAHRSEVVAERKPNSRRLRWGATSIRLVVAGAFNVWSNTLLVAVAFLGLIPLLCLFVLVQWVGRAAGLMRVGVYLERLEEALRVAYPSAPQQVFNWEKSLATTARSAKWWEQRYEWHDFGAIAIFALFAYGSIALGGYRAVEGHETTVLVAVIAEILILSALAVRLLAEVGTARKRARASLDATAEREASAERVHTSR